MSRFGGHQTFYLREGWIYKGLELLFDNPQSLVDDFAFDYLGVGKNMASSIQHWLQALGLATKGAQLEGRKTRLLEPTELATRIWNSDRFLASVETWWILHINILHNRDFAETWYWMFNEFGVDRFEREGCLRRLVRYVGEDLPGNTPQSKTVERDLSCLLNTYAVDVPPSQTDPEEEIWCPFRDLDLMVHYRDSGHIQLQRRRRTVDPYVFMYAMEKCFSGGADANETEGDGPRIDDIRFFDLCRIPNNPMRAFCLQTDVFFESLVDIEQRHPEVGLRIVGLAGDRQIRIPRRTLKFWLEKVYAKEKVSV